MAYNTVKIKNYLNVIVDYPANAAITPGHLIELMSTGKVRKHSTADGDVVPVMFALEDELQGKDITDAFAANDRVQCWIPSRGDEAYALLANGENVVIGDKLSSNGDGTLKKHTVSSAGVVEYPEVVVATALEAVDMSGSSAADPSGRIRVRVK